MHIEVSKDYRYKDVIVDITATQKGEEVKVVLKVPMELDITAFPSTVNATTFPHVNSPSTTVECDIAHYDDAVDGVILAIDSALEADFQAKTAEKKAKFELEQKIKTTKYY